MSITITPKTENDVKSWLSSYAQARAQLETLRSELQEMIQSAIALLPDEQRAIIANTEQQIEYAESDLSGFEQGVKRATTEYGASVKAHGYHAVYSAGRVIWDSKALDGYALAHPEIVAMRKIGEASVSIRRAQGE